MDTKQKKVLIVSIALVGTLSVILILCSTLQKRTILVSGVSEPSSKTTLPGKIVTTEKDAVSTASDISSADKQEIYSNDQLTIKGWKVYANQKVGYSLQYPSDWITGSADGDSFYKKEFLTPEGKRPIPGDVITERLKNINGDYFVNVSVYPDIGKHVTLQEWRKYERNSSLPYLINGQPALKFVTSSSGEGAGMLVYYCIDQNTSNGYEITVRFNGKSDGLAERVISTMSFIK